MKYLKLLLEEDTTNAKAQDATKAINATETSGTQESREWTCDKRGQEASPCDEGNSFSVSEARSWAAALLADHPSVYVEFAFWTAPDSGLAFKKVRSPEILAIWRLRCHELGISGNVYDDVKGGRKILDSWAGRARVSSDVG